MHAYTSHQQKDAKHEHGITSRPHNQLHDLAESRNTREAYSECSRPFNSFSHHFVLFFPSQVYLYQGLQHESDL
eukprot:4432703-Amphidinium_carterae.2